MADNYFEAFPSDELWPSLRDIRHIILLVGLIEFFLLHLLKDKKMIRTLFWGFQPSINEEDKDSGASVKVHRYDESAMKGGDIDFVLRRLGMFSDCGGKGVCLEELFEEEGPRLEELKEAFEVFDEDGDGFIEAEELQKVLCALGLDEGLRVENCKRMIDVFDEDGDGRIGFDEFVKFMESSLC